MSMRTEELQISQSCDSASALSPGDGQVDDFHTEKEDSCKRYVG